MCSANGFAGFRRVFAVEPRTCCELIENDGERVNVCCGGWGLTFDLLRRIVKRCAPLQFSWLTYAVALGIGDAADLNFTIFINADQFWREVQVQEVLIMKGFQCIADRIGVKKYFLCTDGRFFENVLQAGAIHPFFEQEGRSGRLVKAKVFG